MYNFEFAMGEKVKISVNKQTGIVVGRKHEYIEHENGKTIVLINYYVKVSSFSKNWYTEDQLTRVLEVNPLTEKDINYLMIDINLKERNFDMVKQWSEKE